MSDYPYDVLARPPIRIDDSTVATDLVPEMQDRLEALMESYGCDGTDEGWRKLAISLALRHEAAFKVETPVDRTGRSGKGGAPIGMQRFRIRSEVAKERKAGVSKRKAGVSEREAARRVAERLGMNEHTVRSALGGGPSGSDEMRRYNYLIVAEAALVRAAERVV